MKRGEIEYAEPKDSKQPPQAGADEATQKQFDDAIALLGLEQFKAQLKNQDIQSVEALKLLGDRDLQLLGVDTIGQRKAIQMRVEQLNAGTARRRSNNPFMAIAGARNVNQARFKAIALMAVQQTVVSVGYKIQSLGQLDIVLGRFACTFKLFATWQDSLLKGISSDFAKSRLFIQKMTDADTNFLWQEYGLFDPELIVPNAVDMRTDYFEMKVTDAAKGKAKWSKHFSGLLDVSLSTHLLQQFPFDYHDLEIVVRPHKADTKTVRLKLWSGCHTAELKDSGEWAVVGHRARCELTDPSVSSTGKMYSVFYIVLMVERFSGWYFLNVLFFLFGITMSSLTIFLIPPHEGSRMEVATALLLSIIATKFSVAASLPRVHKKTLFDEYVFVCFSFVLTPVVESAYLYKVKDEELATTVNNWSAGLASVIWVVYHIVLWGRLRVDKGHKLRWRSGKIQENAALAAHSAKSILHNSFLKFPSRKASAHKAEQDKFDKQKAAPASAATADEVTPMVQVRPITRSSVGQQDLARSLGVPRAGTAGALLPTTSSRMSAVANRKSSKLAPLPGQQASVAVAVYPAGSPLPDPKETAVPPLPDPKEVLAL